MIALSLLAIPMASFAATPNISEEMAALDNVDGPAPWWAKIRSSDELRALSDDEGVTKTLTLTEGKTFSFGATVFVVRYVNDTTIERGDLSTTTASLSVCQIVSDGCKRIRNWEASDVGVNIFRDTLSRNEAVFGLAKLRFGEVTLTFLYANDKD